MTMPTTDRRLSLNLPARNSTPVILVSGVGKRARMQVSGGRSATVVAPSGLRCLSPSGVLRTPSPQGDRPRTGLTDATTTGASGLRGSGVRHGKRKAPHHDEAIAPRTDAAVSSTSSSTSSTGSASIDTSTITRTVIRTQLEQIFAGHADPAACRAALRHQIDDWRGSPDAALDDSLLNRVVIEIGYVTALRDPDNLRLLFEQLLRHPVLNAQAVAQVLFRSMLPGLDPAIQSTLCGALVKAALVRLEQCDASDAVPSPHDFLLDLARHALELGDFPGLIDAVAAGLQASASPLPVIRTALAEVALRAPQPEAVSALWKRQLRDCRTDLEAIECCKAVFAKWTPTDASTAAMVIDALHDHLGATRPKALANLLPQHLLWAARHEADLPGLVRRLLPSWRNMSPQTLVRTLWTERAAFPANGAEDLFAECAQGQGKGMPALEALLQTVRAATPDPDDAALRSLWRWIDRWVDVVATPRVPRNTMLLADFGRGLQALQHWTAQVILRLANSGWSERAWTSAVQVASLRLVDRARCLEKVHQRVLGPALQEVRAGLGVRATPALKAVSAAFAPIYEFLMAPAVAARDAAHATLLRVWSMPAWLHAEALDREIQTLEAFLDVNAGTVAHADLIVTLAGVVGAKLSPIQFERLQKLLCRIGAAGATPPEGRDVRRASAALRAFYLRVIGTAARPGPLWLTSRRMALMLDESAAQFGCTRADFPLTDEVLAAVAAAGPSAPQVRQRAMTLSARVLAFE